MAPDIAPTVVGFIAEIGGDRVLIKETASDPCGIWFGDLSQSEVLLPTPDGGLRRGRPSDLQVGASIRGWATSVIRDSCPQKTSRGILEVPGRVPLLAHR